MYNKKLAFMEFIGSAFVFSFGMLVKYAFILSEGDVWSFSYQVLITVLGNS